MVIGLLPLRELHDLWAASSGLLGSPAITWSAVHGSFGLGPFPHSQQMDALSRTSFALRL